MYKTKCAKTNPFNRVLSAALSAALLLTMLITFGLKTPTANAADEAGIQSGVPSALAVGDTVYYGTYPQSAYTPQQAPPSPADGETYIDTDGTEFMYKDGGYYKVEPIEWRVLSNADGELFLLSEKNLDAGKAYNTAYTSVTWETSTIRAWLNGDDSVHGYSFIDWAFGSKEQAAILTTVVSNPNNPTYGTAGGNATNDKIFLLSIQEAANAAYGFTNDYNNTEARIAVNTSYTAHFNKMHAAGVADWWWLRSPGSYSSNAASVNAYGLVYGHGDYVDCDVYAARPAFNLDLSSVLFPFSAADGKSSAAAGGGLIPAEPVGANMKFTIKDTSLTLGSVTRTSGNGRTVNFSYTGATAGKTLSAVVLDASGEVKYYGKLKDNITANGSASVTLPEDFAATDTVQIFVEEANGDYLTDYASEYKQLEVPGNLQGSVTITGTAAYGAMLTANTSGITSANPGTLSYQWKRGGNNISGAANSTYTLTSDDIEKTITVTVSAANYFGGLTSAQTAAVAKATPTVSLTANPASGAVYGADNVTLTAAVSGAGATPGGTVTFYNGNTVLQSDAALESGSATISVTLGAGYHDLKAVYSGDGNYLTNENILNDYNVGKGTVTVTAPPTAANIYKGAALSTAALTGGAASVSGSFAWTDGTQTPTASGSFGVTFTPNDTGNYNTASVNVAVTVIDKDGLVNLITKANGIKSAAVIGAGHGQYTQEVYDTFMGAITAAQGVANTPAASNTQTAVNGAFTDLQDAITTFNGAANVVETSALTALITTATDKKNSSTYGERNGDYAPAQETALGNAITAAQTIANKTDRTPAEVTQAITDLQTAINNFNQTLVVVNYQPLTDLIETAKNAKNEAFPGNGNGQTPQTAIDALQAAIDAAQLVAEDDYLSQDAVNGAFTDLTAALSDFYAAKIAVDFTALDAAVLNGKAVQKGNYTDESWNVLQVAIADAEAIRAKANVIQDEVDAAAAALQAAIDGLQENEPEPADPTPGTGDNSNMMLWILLGGAAFILMCGTIAGRKKYKAVKR